MGDRMLALALQGRRETARRTPGFWAWLIVAFLIAPAWAAQSSPTTLPANLPSLDEVVAKLPHFTIAGKVVDKSGQGVEGADVFLCDPGVDQLLPARAVGQVSSGRDGSFRFENAGVWSPPIEEVDPNIVQVQKYYVIARHPRHGLEFAVLLKGDPAENVLVRMDQPATYSVKVHDPAGKPVAGARLFLEFGWHSEAVNKLIEVEHPDNGREYQRLFIRQDIGLDSAMTDAEGKATLPGTPKSSYFLAEKEGYARGFSRGPDIVLCPGAKASGRVIWPDGRPAAGVAVLFDYQGQRLVHRDATMTDAQGRYRFDYLPGSGFYWTGIESEGQKGQGTGMLSVRDLRPGSGVVSTRIAFPINPGDNITKDLSFQQALVLAGKVVDFDTGKPLAGILLDRFIRTQGATLSDWVQLRTDTDGRFRTTVAPGSEVSFQWRRATGRSDGSYLVDQEWQRRNPESYQPMRSEVVNQDRTDLVFKLKIIPVQPLSGRVVDEKGQRVKGAAIYIHPELTEGRSDESGAFKLKAAFKDRDFDICAVTNDKKLGGVAHLKAGATEATITLTPTAAYDGQVATADNLPAGNLKFYLDLRINEQSLYRVREEPTTDAQGKFKAQNLIPGATYYAWWSSDQDRNRDYDYGNATIDLSQVKAGEPIRFKAVQFLNALMGKVVDDKGKPIAGATIDPGYSGLMPQDARMNRKPIVTDAKGEFTISRLAPGTLTLRITAAGYKTGTFRAATDAVDFVATLKGGDQPCVWDLAVVDEAGKPIPNAPVTIWQRTYAISRPSSTTRPAQADSDGKLHLIAPTSDAQTILAVDLPGYDMAFANLYSREDVNAQLVVRKSGEHWRGTVLNENRKPLVGATIRVTGMQTNPGDPQSHISLPDPRDAEGDPFNLSVMSDGEGRFELPRFSGSEMWTNVSIVAPGYARLAAYFDPRQDKGEKTFALSVGARLKGRLVFAGAAPPPGSEWSVSLLQPVIAEGYSFGGSTKVAADWTFSFESLGPGSYQVSAGSQHKAMRKYRCPIPPTIETQAGKTAEVVVNMEEGIPLRGKLVRADGQPPASGYVSASIKGDRWGRGGAQVEADGSWEMYLPREGDYDVQYSVPGMKQSGTFKTIKIERGKPVEPMTIKVE